LILALPPVFSKAAECSIIGEIFPVSTLEEQRVIVAYVEAETQKLDALQKMTKRTIGLLKEWRTMLIAATVTGRLAVGAGEGGSNAD
jgi:hypothetical protein